VGEVERCVSERNEKAIHDTKSGEATETTHESKWQYFTMMLLVNTVMNPQPTLSNVPAASSVLRSTRNLEDGNASTNVSINDNDDEFSEGVSDECQVKKNLGTKKKINSQEEALHLKKRMIKLMEEGPIKESQANGRQRLHVSDESLPSIQKLDNIQRLELRIEFLSRVAMRIQTN